MMRFAYVCADPGVPVFGSKGCSIHVQEVLRVLLDRGAEVDLFALRFGGQCPAALSSVRTHALPHSNSADGLLREIKLLALNEELRRLLSDCGPFDAIYERHSLWSHSPMEIARKIGIPGILEVNAPLITEQLTHRRLHALSAAQRVAELAFRSARNIVAVSAAVAEYVLSFGIDSDRIQVVPNGVRVENFVPRSYSVEDNTQSFTVGFVGSLRPWHGVSDLLEAYCQMQTPLKRPGLKMRIVGDGPQRSALQQQATVFDTAMESTITFVGAVPYLQVPHELAKLDVAVAPYTDAQDCYFSPLKLFEYMAAGLPVVAARTGQVAEILRHEENGLLYEPGNIDALVAALCKLRDDAQLRERLGMTARRDVEQHHTWHQRVEQIVSRSMSQRKHQQNSDFSHLCAS